jgi:DNA-directed RNA polymerase specialized sigma24 family protein
MSHERTIDLAERARAAATGDKVAAHAILEAVQDDIYGLALRMLGQPADAEDAAQEIVESAPAHGVGRRAWKDRRSDIADVSCGAARACRCQGGSA